MCVYFPSTCKLKIYRNVVDGADEGMSSSNETFNEHPCEICMADHTAMKSHIPLTVIYSHIPCTTLQTRVVGDDVQNEIVSCSVVIRSEIGIW